MTKEYQNRTRVLWLAAVALLLVILLAFLQCILVPKYGDLPEGRLIGEYYEAETRHNLLLIGDCEVFESFSTVTLWEEYGISSYIRGSAQQLIWQSYYLLADAIARGEQPEAVVYNVLAMMYDEPQKEEYNRMTLDAMRWSQNKVEAIRASMTEDEDFITYVFPLLRYHDRISELTKEDLTALFTASEPISYNGYLMQTGVVPMETEIKIDRPAEYRISELCFAYLEKMRVLCEENDIELILIKAPTNNWKYHWYDEWDEQVISYANEKGLSYYNFIGMEEEIGIDWTTDTYDAGIHLNVFGAEKMSRYFGRFLSERHGLTDLRTDASLSDAWTKISERYENEKNRT